MTPQATDTGMAGTLLNHDGEDATAHMHHLDATVKQTIDINFRRIHYDLKHIDWSKVVWRNVIIFSILHVYAIYGIWLVLSFQLQWKTLLWAYALHFNATIGTTMGAHRLWAHRTYKALMPLKIYLMICQTISFQNDIYVWARDHRMHHKYSETDADPHNSRRGIFFAHIGWLLCRKHTKVIEKGKCLDLSDLKADSVVMWQKRNYLWMVTCMCFVVPTIVPWYFWNESLISALMVAGFLRFSLFLHITWSINSVAHWIGSKPFDKSICPVQSKILSVMAMGEGWHNYHHVFPWDYRASELGGWMTSLLNFNFTTTIIDLFAILGLVYDRKKVSPQIWKQRMERTGDGSYQEGTSTITKND